MISNSSGSHVKLHHELQTLPVKENFFLKLKNILQSLRSRDDLMKKISDRIRTYVWEHVSILVKYLGVWIPLDLIRSYKVVQGGKSFGIVTKYVYQWRIEWKDTLMWWHQMNLMQRKNQIIWKCYWSCQMEMCC